jgi:hypothetical protein
MGGPQASPGGCDLRLQHVSVLPHASGLAAPWRPGPHPPTTRPHTPVPPSPRGAPARHAAPRPRPGRDGCGERAAHPTNRLAAQHAQWRARHRRRGPAQKHGLASIRTLRHRWQPRAPRRRPPPHRAPPRAAHAACDRSAPPRAVARWSAAGASSPHPAGWGPGTSSAVGRATRPRVSRHAWRCQGATRPRWACAGDARRAPCATQAGQGSLDGLWSSARGRCLTAWERTRSQRRTRATAPGGCGAVLQGLCAVTSWPALPPSGAPLPHAAEAPTSPRACGPAHPRRATLLGPRCGSPPAWGLHHRARGSHRGPRHPGAPCCRPPSPATGRPWPLRGSRDRPSPPGTLRCRAPAHPLCLRGPAGEARLTGSRSGGPPCGPVPPAGGRIRPHATARHPGQEPKRSLRSGEATAGREAGGVARHSLAGPHRPGGTPRAHPRRSQPLA